MKKLFGAAMMVGVTAAGAGAAQAQSVSANVTMVSDYVFRGISLSNEDPAIQGSFDYETGSFYAGVWGSSLGAAGSSMELDVYAGFTPKLGPIALDLGVVGYFYPGADDDGAEFDFYELAASGTYDLTEQLTLGAGVNFSPENYGETGEALVYEANGAFAMTDAFAFSAAFGVFEVDDVNGPLAGATGDDYNYWNLGATYAIHGFELDVRYHEADISAADPIAFAIPPQLADGRVVFSIGRTL